MKEIYELEANAKRLINSENVLDEFAIAWRKVAAGELHLGKMLYLVSTSRLFDKPMSAAIKGTSSGGKSEIRKKVLKFIPEEDVISFTTLSERALIYCKEDFPHMILSMGEAAGAEEASLQNYLLRELISEGKLVYQTVEKVKGEGIGGVKIEKHGPVCFLVTTTKTSLHPENETRLLSLEIDDSAHQTARVLRKIAETEGNSVRGDAVDFDVWRDFQRWLAAGHCRVVIPFADVLATMIPPRAVRLRRDFTQVLTAIKAHALLHRQHRPLDARADIVADIEHDYAVVVDLMGALIAEQAGVALSSSIIETRDAVARLTTDLPIEEGVSAETVGTELGLDKSAARRRLYAAGDRGVVTNLEFRKGKPGKWRVSTEKVAAEPILPSVEELGEAWDASDDKVVHLRLPPCHQRGDVTDVEGESGGKSGGSPVASLPPAATAPATAISLETNDLTPPVARWQENDDLEIPACLDRRRKDKSPAPKAEPPKVFGGKML